MWVKEKAALSKGHYSYQHEACLYCVRKGKTASWQGQAYESSVIMEAGGTGFRKDQSDENDFQPHPTQKPLECMERFVRNHKGDVYEPFAGSGTTVIAAERQNRKCYAIEIDPAYCDVIVQRWEQYTGEKATRGRLAD